MSLVGENQNQKWLQSATHIVARVVRPKRNTNHFFFFDAKIKSTRPFLTDHDLAVGWARRLSKSRGSGRVWSGDNRNTMGRVKSGHEVIEVSRVGSGYPVLIRPARSDPTREQL